MQMRCKWLLVYVSACVRVRIQMKRVAAFVSERGCFQVIEVLKICGCPRMCLCSCHGSGGEVVGGSCPTERVGVRGRDVIGMTWGR